MASNFLKRLQKQKKETKPVATVDDSLGMIPDVDELMERIPELKQLAETEPISVSVPLPIPDEARKDDFPTENYVVTATEDSVHVEPRYTQKGYDIFSTDGGATFAIATIEYNPETKAARVVEINNTTRLVGLQQEGKKQALELLKRNANRNKNN